MRLHAAALALALMAAAPAHAAGRDESPRPLQVLHAQDADIHAFIHEVARLTGATFIVDPSLSGTVSAATPGPASAEEIFAVFRTTMRASGFEVRRSVGGAWRILAAAPESQAL